MNSLETDLIDLNPREEIVVLSFNFEIRKSHNSVNCLGNPEEDNQQPSSCGNTEKGSTTSSESQVDNNSTTKAEHSTYYLDSDEYKNYLLDPKGTMGFLNPLSFSKIEVV